MRVGKMPSVMLGVSECASVTHGLFSIVLPSLVIIQTWHQSKQKNKTDSNTAAVEVMSNAMEIMNNANLFL